MPSICPVGIIKPGRTSESSITTGNGSLDYPSAAFDVNVDPFEIYFSTIPADGISSGYVLKDFAPMWWQSAY